VITRRLDPSVTPVVALLVAAAVLCGHALSRLPSAHLGSGGVDNGVLAELTLGVVLAVVAAAAWMAEGARPWSGRYPLSRVVLVGLLAGGALSGAVALLTEAGNGCLGACG
jgi:hypothetical protein